MASPVIRWAGSKRKLLPVLHKCLPPTYNTYIEPFAGSACLFFSLEPAQAILGDINSELINTYKVLQSKVELVAAKLRLLPRDKDLYYKYRSINTGELDEEERAIRFLYLNRFCFNGVYRTNRSGQFNVPLGTRTGGFPELDTFRAASVVLQRAEMICSDFEHILSRANSGDFVYMDPPYSSKTRKVYGEYGYDSFTGNDLSRLIDAVMALDSRGVQVLVSYRQSQSLLKELSGWTAREHEVQRHVAGFSEFRTKASEVLISNY